MTLAASFATAEEAGAPAGNSGVVDGIDLSDPDNLFSRDRLSVRLGPDGAARFANFGPDPQTRGERGHDFGVEVVARATGGFDVAFSQSGGLGYNDQGDLASERRSSELRLGRGLRNVRRDVPSATPKWYIFAAAEDEALIWQPGARSEFGGAGSSLALQDRVEIGDLQAGITYESNGLQASLAYVEREVSVRAGARSMSRDEGFAGFTLTMRR
jgi:hypothetical protein